MDKPIIIKFSHSLLGLAGVLIVFLLVIAMNPPLKSRPRNLMASQPVNDFAECAVAGNPVIESYPRQCRSRDGRIFTEIIEPNLPPDSINPAGSDP